MPGPWWAELTRDATSDPVSPFNAAMLAGLASIYNTQLTGTVSLTAGSPIVTGTGTQFLTQATSTTPYYFGSTPSPQTYSIASVNSNTQITLDRNWGQYGESSVSGVQMWLSTHIQTSYYGSQFKGGNPIVGMPVNQVAYNTPLLPMTIGFYAAQSDSGPVPYLPSVAIEAWPWDAGTVDATYIAGSVSVTQNSAIVTGSGTAFVRQVNVGDQYCFGAASTTTLYTVQSVDSNTQLTLTAPYAGTTASAVAMAGPFNRPPDFRELSTFGGFTYPGTAAVTNGSAIVTGTGAAFTTNFVANSWISFGDTGSIVIYTILSVDSATQITLTAPYAGTTASGLSIHGPNGPDMHCLVLLPNASGVPITLYEHSHPFSDDGGSTYFADVGTIFNLTTGAQRHDGYTSACAGGTPIMPGLIRYDEAASGSIGVLPRMVMATALNLVNQAIWPALHGVSTGGITDYTLGGIPQGARVRLNAAWIAANKSRFSSINQNIITAMGRGMIVDDLTSGVPFWLDLTPDSRWDKTDLQSLWGIPAVAFELVDTVKPQYVLSSSAATATTGTPITLTVAYQGGSNTNFGPLSIALSWSGDAGVTWNSTGFSSTTVTLSNSSTSGSVTWTPPSSGNVLIRTFKGGQGVYWIDPPTLSVAVSVSSRALTAVASGRWDNPATWGGAAPPTAGDSATIPSPYTVLMVGDVTLGTGAATTCLTVATGVLKVIGCKLTLRGNATIGQTASGVTASPLTVLSSAGLAAGIELDGSSGVTPTISVADDTLLTFTGTSAAHAYLRTKTGTAGNGGIVTSTGTARSFFAQFSYTDFANLGAIATPAIYAAQVSTSTNLTNPPWTMDHCTVTGCGFLPKLTIQDGGVNFRLTNSTWSNPANASQQGGDQGNAILIQAMTGITTGTRLIDQCIFENSSIPWLLYPQDITFTHSFIDPLLSGAGINPEWALFDGNFVHITLNQEFALGGNVTNNFWLYDPPAAAIWPTVILSQYSNCTAAFNVFQGTGLAGAGGNAMSAGEGHPAPRTMYRYNNICLKNDSGDQSCFVMNAADNPPDTNKPFEVCDHNTVYIGSGVGAICGFSSKPVFTGQISSFKNNLFWTDTKVASPNTSQGFIFSCQELSPDSYPDPVSATNADYNAAYNANLAYSSDLLANLTSPHEAASGTLYNIPMSSAPGAHDIVLGAPPPFVDSTRRLQTWSTYMGGPGTVADAIARIKANLTLTKTSLVPWIQAGFTLAGSGSLINSASDGFNRGYDPRATG